MAYTNIDKVNGRIIRKLHNTDKTKTFGFISGEAKNPAEPKGDLINVLQHASLTHAREACGFKHDARHLENLALASMPKSANPQNNKGYHADTANKKAS